MPTANYNFPTIAGTDPVDIVKAVNDPLEAIDSTIKNHGFIYEDIQA